MNKLSSMISDGRYLKLILFAIPVLLLSVLFVQIKIVIVIVLFILLNLLITSYKKVMFAPIEIETLSFGIILCSHSYGIGAGILLAIAGGIAYIIHTSSFNPFSVPMLIGYSLMAVLSALLPITDIMILGFIIIVINNLFVFLTYQFVFSYHLPKNIMFSGSNIIFNAILFFNFGPFIFRLMNLN